MIAIFSLHTATTVPNSIGTVSFFNGDFWSPLAGIGSNSSMAVDDAPDESQSSRQAPSGDRDQLVA